MKRKKLPFSKFLLLLLCSLVSLTGAFAQQFSCGTTEANADLAARYPAYAQRLQQQKTDWAAYNARLASSAQARIIAGAGGSVSYEIPVVFHIIHTGQAVGTSQNPSDATIQNLVSYLNAVYSATWASNPDTNNGGVKIPIQFVLAKRSPTCTATTGINRVNGSSLAGYSAYGIQGSGAVNGADEVLVKDLSRWPNDRYLNIWIVTNIQGAAANGGGVAGYAYYPGAPSDVDGIVLRHDQTNWAIAHEMGHSLGLAHTFSGSSSPTTCPTNFNCATDGDEVCDTDPHPLVSGCPTGTNPCTGNPYGAVTYNIMNYTSCPNRFTAGQRTRAIFQLVNYRSGLAASNASLPMGVYPTNIAAPATACTPGSIANSGNQFGIGPTAVSLGTLSHSSGGYDEDGYRYYIDHTINTCEENQVTGTIPAGVASTLSVTTGLYNAEKARVWIDWNADGVFQTSEQVLSFSGTTGGQTATVSLTPPTNTVTCAPLRLRVVSDYTSNVTNLTACGSLQYGQTEDYTIIVLPGTTQTPSVAISRTGSTTVCANTSLTFTATPTNGGSAPTYQWKVNGVNVGTNSPTYTASSWTNGNTITVTMTSNSTCAAQTPVTSPVITLSVAPLPATPGAVSGPTTLCSGATNTYSVTPVSGNTYTWTLPSGWSGTSTTASISATAGSSGGVLSVKAVNSCGTSAAVTKSVSVTTVTAPTVSINSSATSTCAGTPVTFTATAANSGTSSTYQWKVNGAVRGTNSNTFTSATLSNGDTVRCYFTTTNSACATTLSAASNPIVISISPQVTPALTITPSATAPCAGDTVLFTTTAFHSGTAPAYEWKVNGTPAGSGASFRLAATTPATVTCSLTSNAACATTSTVGSNAVTLAVSPVITPSVTVSATPAGPFTSGQTVVFNATISGGGNAHAFQWLRNGQVVAGANTASWTAVAGSDFSNGDSIGVRLQSSEACARPGMAQSNALMAVVTPSAVNSILPTDFHLYPNPFRETIMISGIQSGDVMTLLDATGKVVLKKAFDQAGQETVSLPPMAAGLYQARFVRRDGQQWGVQLIRLAN